MLDEVDILYSDEDFEPALQTLMNSSPFTTQYLFVTATLPVSIYNKLVEVFPDCEVIMGPGMHRTSPGLEEVNMLANSFSFPAYSASGNKNINYCTCVLLVNIYQLGSEVTKIISF